MATLTRPCKGCGDDIARTVAVAPIRHYCSPDCRPRCAVDGCAKAVHAKGMCAAHAQRARVYGDPTAPFQRQPQRGACDVEGCDQPKRKTGWCAAHYAQAQKTGQPPVPFRYKWAKERRCLVCAVEHGNPCRRRFCSDRCQAMYQNHDGQRPSAVPCVSCGESIDLLCDATRKGHRIRADVKLCRRCRQDKRKHGLSVQVLAHRDGTDCGICGTPVDMSLRRPARMAPSVDHVLPRACGGTNDPANLQLAHLWCNQVKSDRTIPRSGERMVS